MNRTNHTQENPNRFTGCHPVSRLEELDPFQNESAVDISISSSRFTSASFYDGIILWQQQPSLRRQAFKIIYHPQKIHCTQKPDNLENWLPTRHKSRKISKNEK